jgi:hypothetical protein
MPVQRFRTFDDARRALWCDRDDPSLHRRIARLWATGVRLAPLGIPRGVRKFRSIEEANREREQWIANRIRTLAAVRSVG